MSAIVDWLTEHATFAVLMLVASLLVLVVSLWIGHYFLISIPPDYFTRKHKPLAQLRTRPALWWTLLVAKNLVGVLLFAAGCVMIFTPGQGILTLLLGLALLDIPGKQSLERKIIERPHVLKIVNTLRARAHQPPLDFS